LQGVASNYLVHVRMQESLQRVLDELQATQADLWERIELEGKLTATGVAAHLQEQLGADLHTVVNAVSHLASGR
jgi:hypothetical protein